MATYWLIARDTWVPEDQLIAGPWSGWRGKKAARKRFEQLKRKLPNKTQTLTLVKAVF
jgi:hypothetical protein